MSILKGINDLLIKALNLLIVIAMTGMVVLIFAQVIWRYVLRQPLSWSEELAQYLFSVVTLFGAAILFRESKHINMSLLVDKIKNPGTRKLVNLAANLFSLIFLAVIIYYAFPMAFLILEFEVVSYSMEWLMMGWIFLMVPVASVLSALMLIEATIAALQLKEKEAN